MSINFPPINLPAPVELDYANEQWKKPGSEDSKDSTPSESGEPYLYGDQKLFESWKKGCTETTTLRLKALRNEQRYPQNFLRSTLMDLGAERRKIADAMGSEDKEKFGVHRLDPICTERWKESCTVTNLIAPRYRQINQKMRSLFFHFMPLFQENVDRCTFETPFAQYSIEKIDQEKLRSLIALAQNPISQKLVEGYNQLAMLLNSIGLIQDTVLCLQLPDLDLPPFPQVGDLQFLVGTIKTKVKGEWKILTRQITWIKQSKPGPIQQSAIEYFKRFGFAVFVHTPRQDIDLHLESLEKLTRKLIQTDYKNKTNEFKRDLAVWEYKLFHTLPFLRGSASVVEILRQSICDLHTQKVPDTKDTDALAQPFIESYVKQSLHS